MNKATEKALETEVLKPELLSEVYEQGENRILWHDTFFLHLLEVLDSGEIIYQSRPLADDWLFEDV